VARLVVRWRGDVVCGGRGVVRRRCVLCCVLWFALIGCCFGVGPLLVGLRGGLVVDGRRRIRRVLGSIDSRFRRRVL
jgi:hypothetical protein